MVARGQTISVADLDSLATLANAKLGTAIAFPAFAGSDKINLPQTINIQPKYDPAAGFTEGQKVTLYLYGYKTIGGRKTYSWQPVLKAFTGASGSGSFAVTASWNNPSSNVPDGYIAIIPYWLGDGWEYVWSDLGNVTDFTQDGNFDGWNIDLTLEADFGGYTDIPCSHGAWLKGLNRIHKAMFSKLDLFGGGTAFDDTFLVSGPWCVSAGKSLYARLNGKTVAKDFSFYFPSNQSPVSLYRGCEIINQPLRVSNTSGDNYSLSMTLNLPPGIAAGTFTGRVDFIAKGAGADNLANWAFSTVSGMAAVWSFDSFNGNYGILTATFNGAAVANTVLQITIPAGCALNASIFDAPGGLFPCVVINGIVNYDHVATSESAAIGLDYAYTVKKADFTAVFPDNFNIQDGLNAFPFQFPSGVLSACNGVFVASTLASLGQFTYLDQDLPNYNPSNSILDPDSRRATNGVPIEVPKPQVGNRQALWPFFRDTDFQPTLTGPYPLTPSSPWSQAIATKEAGWFAFSDTVLANNYFFYSIFVATNTANVRFYVSNPNITLYVKANGFPTIADFDASAAGGTWLSLKDAVPGFQKDTTWFYAVYNATGNPIGYTITTQSFESLTAPNGTFFPTVTADDGTILGAAEGISYHFGDETSIDANTTPLLGYCIYELTLERSPVLNAAGVSYVPSTNADLQVKVGVMRGFGFDTAGVFETLDTFVIPAGKPSLRVSVFWPITSGTPLAYQSASPVIARASVNFQPAMYCNRQITEPLIFDNYIAGEQTPIPSTVTPLVNGNPQTVQEFRGQPWYNQNRALLFFKGQGGSISLLQPIVLPVCADVYNDLEATLNLLP